MVSLAERPPLGNQEPRIAVVPKGEPHPLWDQVVEFVDRLGIRLDPWQVLVLEASLRRRGDTWAAFTVAVCCPRQNGKNAILEVRELLGPLLLGERLVIHSAHLADTSKEGFRRLEELIDEVPWLANQVRHIWRTNGHEAIEFTNGGRIRFRTRTRSGGRGFSGSPVMFDEPMFLSEISMGSILPVISAQPDPQVWYTGSAVDQSIHDEGFVFARVRERALSGEDDRLAYFEWSLEAETPDQVESFDAADPDAWAQTNPALGIRISPDYVRAERRELDDRTFAVERLGVGDWPPSDGSNAQAIPIEKWDALADDPAADGARLLDPIVLATDVTPDRASSAIVAVGRRADDLFGLEVVDHRTGTAWVPARLEELVGRHETLAVLLDATGPAGTLLPRLEELDLGVDLEAVSAGDHARACGFLFDLVDERGLRHLGGSNLRNAIKGATKRPLGDAWAWSRRNSTVDISPLVAATLAAWGFSIREPDSGGVAIW